MKALKAKVVLAAVCLGPGCVEREVAPVGEAETEGAADDDDDDDDDGVDEAGDAEAGSADGSSGGTTGDPETSGESGPESGTTGEPGECPDGVPMLTLSGKAGVTLTIDGEGPFDFIVDTGAPTTVIDPSVAAQIGAGEHVVHVAGEDLPPKSSFDQLQIASMFPDATGVLGMDLLGGYAIHFDYPRARFWIDDGGREADLRACPHLEGAPETVPMQSYGGYLWVQGAMEDYDGWMLLDTGATLGAVVDTAFDVLDSGADRPALQGFYTQAIIGTFWADLTTLGDVSIAGAPVDNVLARTIPEFQLPPPPDESAPMLGLLPTPFLRHFLVTVDIPAGTFRIDRAADDAGVEAPWVFPYGIGTELSATPPIHVGQVMPGSAADEQGVDLGDRIVAVNGQTFNNIGATSRPWALVSFVEGTSTTFTFERDGEFFDVVLDARNLLLPP